MNISAHTMYRFFNTTMNVVGFWGIKKDLIGRVITCGDEEESCDDCEDCSCGK